MNNISKYPVLKNANVTIINNTTEDIKKEEPDHFVMIHALIPTAQSILPIVQVFKGKRTIDHEDMKKKIAAIKSNIVLVGSESKKQQSDIEKLIKILIDDYGYSGVDFDASFNFFPEM